MPTRDELDTQAEALGLNPAEFSTKEEVAEAIAEIEPPAEDTSGRPPLNEVAEETRANRNVRTLDVVGRKEG